MKNLLVIGLCGQSVFLRVPHFHRPEETLHAASLFTEPGGKGYNQAVAAARMGAQTVFCGAVGRDADGEACAGRLRDEGILPRMAYKEGKTAYACILTDDAGENRVTVYPGVQLTAEDVCRLAEDFAQAGLLLLTPEIPEEAFAAAMTMAKRYEVPVVLNPAPVTPWVGKYAGDAWLITPNRAEACALLGCAEDELAQKLAASPYANALVTLGKDGALCVADGRLTHIPAKAASPVDTTGAGDCANGVLCARLLAGDSLLAAAEAAVRAASISVTRAHVQDAMPYACELCKE